MIRVNNNSQEEEQPEIPINPATKRDELEIKTLQNAPREEGKLIELLKLKERQRMSKKPLTLKTHKG